MADGREQHRVWESIAESFDRSRSRRWPHVEAFLEALSPASRVLDLMAGNGRHTASVLDAGHRATWLDWSRPAARIAARRYPTADAVVGDATHLPFTDASFDAAILVAGLHSIPSIAERAEALRELHRILRPGGTAQITVWSRNAPRFRSQGLPEEPLDVLLPWRADGHDVDRRYHLYTPKALRDELEAAGFDVTSEAEVSIVSDKADNLVAVARRG